jgi:hypothetical protein
MRMTQKQEAGKHRGQGRQERQTNKQYSPRHGQGKPNGQSR